MGQLVKGKWVDEWYDTTSTDGEFVRPNSNFHGCITSDNPSESGEQPVFPAEKGRYHLYVSMACPWAHRAIIFRKLKGLEHYISLSIVSHDMLEHGWTFDKTTGSSGDPLYHCDYLHQLYTKTRSDYTGRVTVPILWDKKTQHIVNNESSEIIRIFNSAFNALTGNKEDFYPEILREQIDSINEFVYKYINNGVYKCGFSTTQHRYEEAYYALFNALDQGEAQLKTQRFLTGDQVTEADWRLFTTLIRFDAVYFGHFKCNKKRIEDFPQLSQYLRRLYQWPGIAETVNFYHIKRHYYYSHIKINPTQLVPVGPDIDYWTPRVTKK